MEIVHVYSKNMDMFVEAVKGTDCRLNASDNLDYLIDSLTSFNARDVLGLIVFANPFTKKCCKLIQNFDELFVYKKMPVVVITDKAKEMYEKGYFQLKNSRLFLINSEDNSISDVELNSVFTTLLALNSLVYDLSVCPAEVKHRDTSNKVKVEEIVMSDNLKLLLETI